MSNSGNKLFSQCGIFMGAVLALFLLLSLFALLARKNWERGLRAAVRTKIPANEYAVGEMVKDCDTGESAACFELAKIKSDGKNEKCGLVMVMRAATYYGPIPAVFAYEEGRARFLGVAYMESTVSREFQNQNARMDFWLSKAQSIFRRIEEARP